MKRSIRFSLIGLIIATFLAVDTSRVAACTCMGGQPLLDTLANSAAVFSGKVITDEQPYASSTNNLVGSVIAVAVTNIWKGPTNSTLMIVNQAMCSYPFEIGREYLIFAREIEGHLVADGCNRTQPIEAAGQDIEWLNGIFLFPLSPPQRLMTVTARGSGFFIVPADHLWVVFRFAQVRTDDLLNEAQRAKLVETLIASGIPQEILPPGTPSVDRYGIQFTVAHEQLPHLDVAAFLDQMGEAQTNVSKALALPIGKVEVMFMIRDCTQLVWAGQRSAIADARLHAEILADMFGGRLGAITEIADITEQQPPAEGEFVQCGSIKMGKWHELPLKDELKAVNLIRMQSTLQVTFAVEKAVSGVQKPLAQLNEVPRLSITAPVSPLATPTPVSVSPLPTATPG